MNGMLGTTDAPKAGLIKDTTTAGFRQDVLAESMDQPVLVDFWAPWCGPCRQLTPILEKAVAAAGGRVKLVKLNIDEHPAIPGQLGIKSIPAVFAFSKGQPVDGFVGALPEGQIKQFIDRLTGPAPDPIADALAEAEEVLASGDAAGAAEIYGAILAEVPGHPTALAGMAKIQLDLGSTEQARRLIDAVPAEKRSEPAVAAVLAALTMAEQAAALGETAELERAVANNPADHQARYDLALALASRSKREEAIDHLVDIVKRDRNWNDDAARKQLLQFFEAWGPMDDMTILGRRRLSAVLFR
jgi:putative thioredoxin